MALTLMVSDSPDRFEKLKTTFKGSGFQVADAAGVDAADVILKELTVDLLIVDEKIGDDPGIDYLKRKVMENPFMNSALVSTLSYKDYHEVSEGLGVIMQLSENPTEEESLELLEKVKEIIKVTNNSRSYI